MSEFLAEAAVLIQANTIAFRKELEAALATVPKAITIPIVAAAPKGGTASAAAVAAQEISAAQAAVTAASQRGVTSGRGVLTFLDQESSRATEAAAALQRLSAAHREGIGINSAFAATEKAVATASLNVVGAANAQQEAQIALQRNAAAGAAARQLLTEAELAGLNVERLLQNETVRTALALGEKAAADTAAAGAAERHAAALRHQQVQLANVSRGAATSALAAIGLRGATLTANAAFIGGAAAAITFGKSIQAFAGFETTLNTFQATAGATADQMIEISDAAKQLGSDITLPSVSAQDAADAMLELAKAGLSVQDSIAGARGVLQLATAANIDNAQATQIAASALNAFGLAGDQAVHVADVLANAANESQGSIADVGLSLQQAAAVSRQVGVSFEDTVALLTLLARNGIRGSDAGTSLRVAFTKLINPTARAAEILKQFNLQLRDQQGNLRPEVFAEFAAAQSNLSKSQQDANAGIVFGTDALRAYSIAAREGLKGINDVRGELEKQGTAAELAGARTKGTSGAFENLKNQAARLGIAIGEGVAPATNDFINILSGGIENMATATEKLNELSGSADDTKQSFADLAAEAGKINFAVAARNGEAGQGLLDEQQKLNKALEESLGPGVAATQMIEGYRDALRSAAEQADGLRQRVDESADRFAKQPVPATPAGPTPIGPSAKLEHDLTLAAARGNLQALEDFQKKALTRAKAAFANSRGNVEQRTALFQKMTQAEAALATTQQQISDKIAADQKQKAQDAKDALKDAAKARQEADQAIIDSFTGGQNKISIADTQAGATERLSDDIAVQKLIAATASREIAIIDKSVKDVKTRNAAIAARVQILVAAAAELDRLRKQVADTATENARTARNQLTDTLGKRLQLAELIGGKNNVLAAFDKAIADARKRVSQAKKLGLVQLDEKIALQTLVNDRKKFLEDLEKEAKDTNKQATTAFDLLTQFSQTFNQNAGNLINGNQPFAGPTGFTADIAQFLIRRQQPAAPATTAAGAKTPIQLNDDRLVRSLDRLTDAINGNTSTSDKDQPKTVWQSRRWHMQNTFARQFQEA